jgi:muramoyltetrapeptide carboxypeptidase LdcA involved in peptidoglycan recycling
MFITIFCDFSSFSAKKLAFFSKTNVMITIFGKTSSSLSKKRQFFRKNFWRKYLKNHNIGPWCATTQLMEFRVTAK